MTSHRHVDLKNGSLDRRRRMGRVRGSQKIRHTTLPLRTLLRPRAK